MNVLIWTASGQYYATDTRCVIEVVPMVDPRPMAHVMDWVRGMMNYRGRLVPLLDASALLGQAPVESRMSSRILVIGLDDGDQTDDRLIGLLVQQVLDVRHLDFTDPAGHPGLETPEGDYLGPVALTEVGTVQLLEPDRILKPEHRKVLFERTGASAS